MDESSRRPDSVTTALVISEESPRTQKEAFESTARKKPLIDTSRPRESTPEVHRPPNAAGQKEAIPVLKPKTEKKPDLESEEVKKKKLRIRVDLNRIAKARSPLRKIGVPLFASDEEIVKAQQETVRNYHESRIKGLVADKTIDEKLEVQAEAGMRDVMGLVKTEKQENSQKVVLVDETQKRNIEQARAQRLGEIEAMLSAIERASDEKQLAAVLEGMIPNGSYDTIHTINKGTNEVTRVTSRGNNGLETVMVRGRQTMEKVIHPATLKRDGITDASLIARAKRAEERLSKAYPYIRDSLKQKMDHSDKVDFHARKGERAMDEKLRLDREAAKQAEILRQAARAAQEAEAKRQREESLRVERDRVQREAAEKLEREEIKKTRQVIERVIKDKVLNIPEVRENIQRTETAAQKARMKEALIQAYNNIFYKRNNDPKSERLIKYVFYPNSNESSYLSYLANASQFTSEKTLLSYIDMLVSIRLEQSKRESDGYQQIRRYVDPETNTWLGLDNLDERFSNGIETMIFQGKTGPERSVTVKGFKEYESRRIMALAREKVFAQFQIVDGKRVLKDLKITDTLTLRHTDTKMRTDDPKKIEFYVLSGRMNGKTYTARLHANLVLFDVSYSK